MGGKVPFPHYLPSNDESEANQERTQDIGGRPAVGVATGLESDEAVIITSTDRKATPIHLQQRQPHSGQNAADVIDAFEYGFP
jgi:hypothetical protein